MKSSEFCKIMNLMQQNDPLDWTQKLILLAEIESHDSEKLCGACNGSGEGMYDGTVCSTCKGKGVEQ